MDTDATLPTPESDAFLDSLVEKILLDGFCCRCKKIYQLSIAKMLLPDPQLVSLEFNGFIYVPCPCCFQDFKVRPSTHEYGKS